MTVESTSRKQTYAGGQSALTFSFRTLVAHPEYIKVLKTLTSTGTNTDLTYNSDYTVSVNADGVGGIVTVSPSVSTAYTMTVYRDTDDLQESDYDDFNQFPADTLEDDLDRRTLISQEKAEEVDRTAKLPISSTINSVTLPNPVDGLSLVWSGNTGAMINTSLTGATGAIGPTGATGSAMRVAAGFFSYNLASTSGSMVITGVGFTPKAVFFTAVSTGTTAVCMGMGILNNGSQIVSDIATSLWSNTSIAFQFVNTGSNSVDANISAVSSDGYTLTFTKGGTPAGLYVVRYVAMG